MTGRRGQRGFTLLELLIVLVIMALVMGLVVPRLLGRFPSQVLGNAAAGIVMAIDTAQLRAMSQGRDAVVRFDPDRRAVTLDGAPIGPPWPAEVTVRSVPAQLAFRADYGSSGGTIDVQTSGLVRRLRVDPLTGRVRTVDPGGERVR